MARTTEVIELTECEDSEQCAKSRPEGNVNDVENVMRDSPTVLHGWRLRVSVFG